jgi:hypothetical protein
VFAADPSQKILGSGPGLTSLREAGADATAAMIAGGQSAQTSVFGSSAAEAAAVLGMLQNSNKFMFSDLNTVMNLPMGSNLNFSGNSHTMVVAGCTMKPSLVSSLEQTKGDILDGPLETSDAQGESGRKRLMGIASSSNFIGMEFIDSPPCSLSFLENLSHEVGNNDCLESSQPDSDYCQVSNVANICDIEVSRKGKEGMMDVPLRNVTNEQGGGLQGSMGIASSPRTNGESSKCSSNFCSLSLIENGTKSHYHSTEEVIAFGVFQSLLF